MVKILIKRRFKTDDRTEILPLLNQMRTAAMSRSGYVSGETLFGYNDPNTMLVISTWQSMKDWLEWKESTERQEKEKLLEVYQDGPTEYHAYHVGAPPR